MRNIPTPEREWVWQDEVTRREIHVIRDSMGYIVATWRPLTNKEEARMVTEDSYYPDNYHEVLVMTEDELRDALCRVTGREDAEHMYDTVIACLMAEEKEG